MSILSTALRFDDASLPAQTEALRLEVRAFLAEHLSRGTVPDSDFNAGASPDFSRALGERGWIGMTWPKRYGGGERSYLERYVVTEELLAAGAPVGSHWIGDRQTGPLLLKYGAESQRALFMPGIARGEIYFSIGMSEPGSGSDLASVRTSARKEPGGWRINGTKIWTSGAHCNHYMVTLARTTPGSERREGLSQLLVDLKSPDVHIRPIRNLAGEEDFNEVFFDDAFVADEMLVGQPGNGWQQVVSELSFERSGPERFLSTFQVLVELIRFCGSGADELTCAVIGRLTAHLATLRQMSISVAASLEKGEDAMTQAALVKDLGNLYEQMTPELVRSCLDQAPDGRLGRALFNTILHAPSFSLRGGTREVLRGLIARGLGLR